MSDITSELTPTQTEVRPTPRLGAFANEDWWSVWIGLALVTVAWLLFASGSSIK